MSKRKTSHVPPSIKPLTKNQEEYIDAIYSSTITICTGPAGTGKTHISCGIAAKLLREEKASKIIIARPLVLCGNKDMGAFPGDVDDKVGPYMRPLTEAFEFFFPKMELNGYLNKKTIEMIPLELLRGSSLKDSFIICDEAQNASFAQLHMFLTRFGRGCKVVVTGDVKQADIHDGKGNALAEVVRRFRPKCHRSIRIVELDRGDMVRHPLLSWIDERLSDDIPEGKQEKGWVEDECPNCSKTIRWNENDTKHEVEQVECWFCRVVLDVFDDESLSITDIKLRDCLKTCETK